MTLEPFPLLTPNNFGEDQRTRIALFAMNVGLLQSETLSAINVSLMDTRNLTYNLPVESLTIVPGFDWLYSVIVRLPEDSTLKGDGAITLTLRGLKSNTVLVAIH